MKFVMTCKTRERLQKYRFMAFHRKGLLRIGERGVQYVRGIVVCMTSKSWYVYDKKGIVSFRDEECGVVNVYSYGLS